MNKKWWWVIGAIIALIIIGVVIFLVIYLNNKKSEKNTSAQNTGNTSQSSEDPLATNNPNEKAQNGTGWKIFKNFAQGYLIEYPDGATVENASSSESEVSKPANEAACVKVSTKYVWVVIASRTIADDTSCLRTGFGTEWSNAPTEVVTAAGVTYDAQGMKTEAASAGYYQDDYLITTTSGEKIEYGISVNEKYDTAMTKAQAKELVHKIVASFSPAE
jgi:hypothetical protein